MQKYSIDHTNKRAGHFHPSASTACSNLIMFDFYGLDARISTATQRIFDLGTAIHEQVQHAWIRAGILQECEKPIWYPELAIGGHVDGVGVWNGQPFVLEIKSINTCGFIGHLPHSAHVEQVQLYMHFLGVAAGIVLYINKAILDQGVDLAQLSIEDYMNPEYFKLCLQRPDHDIVTQRLRQYEMLKWYADRGLIIDTIKYDESNRECNSCRYKWHCKDRD